MNAHPARRLLSAPQTRGLAITSSALALLTMFCLQLASSNRAAWQSVLEAGPANLDQALAALCGSLALALALWLLSALFLSLMAALGSGSSALGTALASGARVLAPKALRNAVAALLGVAIVATPAAAQAGARGVASEPLSLQIRSSQGFLADEGLSPAWAPSVTRTPATQTSAPRSDLLPGWVPDRPPDSERSSSGRPTPERSTSEPVESQRPKSERPKSEPPKSEPPKSERSETREPGSAAADRRPTEPSPMESPTRRTRLNQDDEIVVRRGDTLWSLTKRHLGPGATDGEIAHEWPHWFTANRAVIGDDPDHLVPGERLRPPNRAAHSEPNRTGTQTRTKTSAKPQTGAPTKAGAEIRGAW